MVNQPADQALGRELKRPCGMPHLGPDPNRALVDGQLWGPRSTRSDRGARVSVTVTPANALFCMAVLRALLVAMGCFLKRQDANEKETSSTAEKSAFSGPELWEEFFRRAVIYQVTNVTK